MLEYSLYRQNMMWFTSTVTHFLTDVSQGTCPNFLKGWCTRELMTGFVYIIKIRINVLNSSYLILNIFGTDILKCSYITLNILIFHFRFLVPDMCISSR